MDEMKNPYKDGFEISFSQLAKDDPDFAKVLKPPAYLNFRDPQCVLQLNKSLMKRDFGLEVELPNDRLCPGVPNRLNYVLWVHDLLSTSTPYGSALDREVTGLDVGTGASAIYPLLGCATNPSWRFLATDIDAESLAYAKRNIENNNLAHRIRLIPSTSSAALIPIQSPKGDVNTLDFVMCNPPFYASEEDLKSSAERKAKPPNSACTGSANEMVTPGGEVAFITRIIEESLILWERVQWYTSMVGMLSSLKPLIERLQQEGCTNWAVGELVQGHKTRRWVLGWSWQPWRPAMKVARGVGAVTLERKYLPFPPEYTFPLPGARTVVDAKKKLDTGMKELCVRWEWDGEKGQGVGFTGGDVWSRAARRKRKDGSTVLKVNKLQKRARIVDDNARNVEAFGFRISVAEVVSEAEEETIETGENSADVKIEWIKGDDSVLLESFCGMAKRMVETEFGLKRGLEKTETFKGGKKRKDWTNEQRTRLEGPIESDAGLIGFPGPA